MKNLNNIIYPLSAAAALMFAPCASAQEEDLVPMDSLSQDIPLLFRTSDGGDILGGVSSVNMVELGKKS